MNRYNYSNLSNLPTCLETFVKSGSQPMPTFWAWLASFLRVKCQPFQPSNLFPLIIEYMYIKGRIKGKGKGRQGWQVGLSLVLHRTKGNLLSGMESIFFGGKEYRL